MRMSINLNVASTVRSLNQDSSESLGVLLVDERCSLPPLRVQVVSMGSNRRVRAFGVLRGWRVDAQKVKDELRRVDDDDTINYS